MKTAKLLVMILGALFVFSTSAYAVVNVVEYNTVIFVQIKRARILGPIIAGMGDDWGWTHKRSAALSPLLLWILALGMWMLLR